MSSDSKEDAKKKAAKPAPAKPSNPEKAVTPEKKEEPKPAETKPVPAKPTPPAAKPATAPAAAKPPAAAAPPPKKDPEPSAFEKGLAQQISLRFGDGVKILYIRPRRIKVMAEPGNIVEVAAFLRDNMGFDHAESASGTDYPKEGQIEVDYHLGSYNREDILAHIIVLATKTNRDDARLPSLINVYPSVEYHERETYEMLGVYFEGHPRNDRFLLPEDWADIPPLRKDFRIKGR